MWRKSIQWIDNMKESSKNVDKLPADICTMAHIKERKLGGKKEKREGDGKKGKKEGRKYKEERK